MTARERAIQALYEAFQKPFGSEVPRSVAATIVNELLAAVAADVTECPSCGERILKEYANPDPDPEMGGSWCNLCAQGGGYP